MNILSGDDGGGDTLVPIPNTTVKPSSADGTCSEGSRESRTLPGGYSIPYKAKAHLAVIAKQAAKPHFVL